MTDFEDRSPPVPHRFLRTPHAIGLTCAAFNGGQPKGGVELGPSLILQKGLVGQIEGLGWRVHHSGKIETYDHLVAPEDDPSYNIVKKPRLVGRATQAIYESVLAYAKQGYLAVTLGGDHSIAMGSVAAVAACHPDVRIIWVDAHADINTPETTESGNLHGMPVAFLMGLTGCAEVPGFEWLKPCIKPSQIAYIGLRDVDGGEKKILKQHKIKAFSMHDVDRYGIGKIMDMAIDAINPQRHYPIHLSFDIDALDPTVAPSTGTPVRGGLTFREGHFICEIVAETGLLVGLDVVEVNPILGDSQGLDSESCAQTVSVGCSIIRASLGETLL